MKVNLSSKSLVLVIFLLVTMSCFAPTGNDQPTPTIEGTQVQASPTTRVPSTIPGLPSPTTLPPTSTDLPVQTQPPVRTEIPTTGDDFTLQRLSAIVKAGLTPPLPKVEIDEPQAFPPESIVTVNTAGEALIQGTIDGQVCKIFVFSDTRLQKKSCPKSTFTGSNVSCIQDGSAIFDQCSNMLVQTPTGEFRLTGTWIIATYLRDRQATVLMVNEGSVEAYPVTDASTYQLGQPETIVAGEFIYTAPDEMLSQIEVPGLNPRQAYTWDRLPALAQAYNLDRWMQRQRTHARQSNVPFPDLNPQATTPPDLIIGLESRDPSDSDRQLMAANPDLIGIPVRATVQNQGGQPAEVFKISIEGTASDGTFIRSFTLPNQADTFYPFTSGPMDPNDVVSFDGVVFFPYSVQGELASLVATADSCSGEEFTPDSCRVAESDEDNNQSDLLYVTILPVQ